MIKNMNVKNYMEYGFVTQIIGHLNFIDEFAGYCRFK